MGVRAPLVYSPRGAVIEPRTESRQIGTPGKIGTGHPQALPREIGTGNQIGSGGSKGAGIRAPLVSFLSFSVLFSLFLHEEREKKEHGCSACALSLTKRNGGTSGRGARKRPRREASPLGGVAQRHALFRQKSEKKQKFPTLQKVLFFHPIFPSPRGAKNLAQPAALF